MGAVSRWAMHVDRKTIAAHHSPASRAPFGISHQEISIIPIYAPVEDEPEEELEEVPDELESLLELPDEDDVEELLVDSEPLLLVPEDDELLVSEPDEDELVLWDDELPESELDDDDDSLLCRRLLFLVTGSASLGLSRSSGGSSEASMYRARAFGFFSCCVRVGRAW